MLNIVLWLAQVLLALFCLMGGSWKFSSQAKLLPVMKVLPAGVWPVLGALEILCAVGLLLPALSKSVPAAPQVSASILAAEGVFLAVTYGLRNARFSASNPMVYALAQAVLAVFIAYGRFALKPL